MKRKMNLQLFGGEGIAPAQSAGSQQAPISAPDDNTGNMKDTADKVTAAVDTEETGTSTDPERDRKAKFDALIAGEYKDLFEKRVQGIINRRFAENKSMEEKLKSQGELISRLSEKYGTDDMPALLKAVDEDDELWKSVADASDMSVEQYRTYRRLERENAALRAHEAEEKARKAAAERLAVWQREGEAVRAKYPDFAFETELQNESFSRMLRSGVSVEAAYRALHHDDILAGETARAAAEAERRITENIRARGERPGEAGAAGDAGVMVRRDVSKLTRAQRAEIAKRAMMGGKIEF